MGRPESDQGKKNREQKEYEEARRQYAYAYGDSISATKTPDIQIRQGVSALYWKVRMRGLTVEEADVFVGKFLEGRYKEYLLLQEKDPIVASIGLKAIDDLHKLHPIDDGKSAFGIHTLRRRILPSVTYPKFKPQPFTINTFEVDLKEAS